MRAPVPSSLANRGAEPCRQARESVHLAKWEKKNFVCKKDKKSVQDASHISVDSSCCLKTALEALVFLNKTDLSR